MLVIRRRPGQAIIIAGNVEVQVVEVSGKQVKLGIVAPREIPVNRKEVQLTAAENARAAQPLAGEALEALVENFRR